MRICPNCHIAILGPHPTFLFWTKCSICAFSDMPLEEMSPVNRLLAEVSPFTKDPLTTSLEVVESAQAKWWNQNKKS